MSSLRRIPAVVFATVFVAAGVIIAIPSPADAATPGFSGSNAPLEWNGTLFEDPPPGESGSGAAFLSGSDDMTWVGSTSHESLVGIAGTSNLHVVLVSYDFGSGVQNITIYVSDQFFQSAPGGPFPATCTGANDALFDGDPACQAFKADILTANGAGNDFSYTGTSGFVDSSNNPTTEPSVPRLPPAVVWPLYQGTASPLSLDGLDYTDNIDDVGGSGTGANWIPGGQGPQFVATGDDGLANFPNADLGSIYPTHTLLVNQGGVLATAYLDGMLLAILDPMNPFPADCPGFGAFLAAGMQPGIDCVAFRADIFAPPATLGEQYTCATNWFDEWTDENGDPLGAIPTVVDGFLTPALTPVGVDTGPGVCPAYVPPDPPDPPTPPNTIQGGGGSGDGSGGATGTGSGAGTNPTGTTPTLPATGATTPALLLGALALLAAGAAVTVTTRRRRRGATDARA